MTNYKGYIIEMDELFGVTVYDEDGCPLSIHFDTVDEAKAVIDRF